MPSSNGVYSLPPGYLATTGQPILASQHNPIFEDVAQALTLRLSRDGTAPMTGVLNLAAGTVTAPSLIFQGNVSNGIYPTTNGIGVGIGGAQVAEFLPGGINGARFIGELIPYTGTTARPLTVLPQGQTLNRITYATLWTFAQTEIAAGNTLYNNGDGSTTFGVPDMRGCVLACFDPGNVTGRLTAPNAAALGSTGGAQTVTLIASQIPALNSVNNASISISVLSTVGNIGTRNGASANGAGVGVNQYADTQVTSTGTIGIGAIDVVTNNTGGAAHSNVQPTLVTNYLLYAGA